jgi:cell wall-associated NlpC family hydrolase
MAFVIQKTVRCQLSAVLLVAAMAWVPGYAGAQSAGPAVDSSAFADSEASPISFESRVMTRGDSLVELARRQIGARYVYGGESPEDGFDCSGLVQYVLSRMDIDVPRTAARQAAAGSSLPRDTASLQPGDLVTFGKGSRASHVGIYVGDGYFVHASSVAGRVIESRLIRPPARRIKPWRGARRLVASPAATAVESSRGSTQEHGASH